MSLTVIILQIFFGNILPPWQGILISNPNTAWKATAMTHSDRYFQSVIKNMYNDSVNNDDVDSNMSVQEGRLSILHLFVLPIRI